MHALPNVIIVEQYNPIPILEMKRLAEIPLGNG